jgi:F-type H+-transporting ATPase subunit b
MSFETVIASAAIVASDKPPNPLIPKTPELIVGGIAFLLLLWALQKWAYPMFEQTFAERTAAIEGGIQKAEKAQAEASAALEQYQAQLSDARGEASAIRTEAQAERARIVDDARTEAQSAADQVTARASAQVEADRASAQTELSREVGRIALELAERVVGESLADDARVRATIDRFITELEQAPEATR